MPSLDRLASYTALLIAGLVAAASINAGGFVAGGTDSSGYVSAADRWREREIVAPAPLHLWANWPNAQLAASPVAYRPGLTSGIDVSVYPLGFPLFIAAAVVLAGPTAAYLVAPAFAGVLTWCTFMIGRRLAGPAAGLFAAALVASTPVTLLHAIHPMSDVPAAAFWTLAWLMSLAGTAGGAAAAGAAVSAAIMIRPNLAPLAIVPAVLVLTESSDRNGAARRWQWARLAPFAAMASIGPLTVAWSQAVLYGGSFVPGYVEWGSFFRVTHVKPNLSLYPRLLLQVHGPLVFVGLATPLLMWRGGGSHRANRERMTIALSAMALLIVNVAIYLPYLSLDGWPFLRFLLPGLAALFISLAAAVVWAATWLSSKSRWLAPLALIPLAFVVRAGLPEVRYTMHDWFPQARIRLMGFYLQNVLPPDAAVLSFVHSGAVRHYTGAQVVRLDLLNRASLDRVVDDLRRHGYRPVFVLDEILEGALFRARFATSQYGLLDWAPRATFTTTSSIWYFEAEDRDRHLRGERWPVDHVH